MPKFHVTLEETVRYVVTVEADNEREAREDATEMFLQSDKPFDDFHGSVEDRTVFIVLPALPSSELSTVS
jgi:hypothetical protein